MRERKECLPQREAGGECRRDCRTETADIVGKKYALVKGCVHCMVISQS